jgi:putative transposase
LTRAAGFRVIRALDELIEIRGKPSRLRLDNGPELISATRADWARNHAIQLSFIQPGKPTQNAYIERFSRTYRTEVLDRYIFNTVPEVRRMTEDWRHRYNHLRPHRPLGNIPPARYAVSQSLQPSTSGKTRTLQANSAIHFETSSGR